MNTLIYMLAYLAASCIRPLPTMYMSRPQTRLRVPVLRRSHSGREQGSDPEHEWMRITGEGG